MHGTAYSWIWSGLCLHPAVQPLPHEREAVEAAEGSGPYRIESVTWHTTVVGLEYRTSKNM